MRYTGTVVAENLLSDSILNFVEVKKRENGSITFEVGGDLAAAVADEISQNLKDSRSMATLAHEFDTFVIFKGKVFRFAPTEVEKKQKAIEYAKTLGITEINF